MSASKEALEDLRWLGKRLKGVLAMLPILEEYDTVDNFILEKRLEAKNIEAEVNGLKTTLKQKTQEKKNVEEEIKETLEVCRKEADEILMKSKLVTKKNLDDALESYKDEEARHKDSLSRIMLDISASENVLSELEASIKAKTLILDELQKQLDTLKNRFI